MGQSSPQLPTGLICGNRVLPIRLVSPTAKTLPRCWHWMVSFFPPYLLDPWFFLLLTVFLDLFNGFGHSCQIYFPFSVYFSVKEHVLMPERVLLICLLAYFSMFRLVLIHPQSPSAL